MQKKWLIAIPLILVVAFFSLKFSPMTKASTPPADSQSASTESNPSNDQISTAANTNDATLKKSIHDPRAEEFQDDDTAYEYTPRDISIAEGLEQRTNLIQQYHQEIKRIRAELTEAQVEEYTQYQAKVFERRNWLMQKITDAQDEKIENQLIEELNELDKAHAKAKRELYGDQNAAILKHLADEDREVIERYFNDEEQVDLMPFPEFAI